MQLVTLQSNAAFYEKRMYWWHVKQKWDLETICHIYLPEQDTVVVVQVSETLIKYTERIRIDR